MCVITHFDCGIFVCFNVAVFCTGKFTKFVRKRPSRRTYTDWRSNYISFCLNQIKLSWWNFSRRTSEWARKYISEQRARARIKYKKQKKWNILMSVSVQLCTMNYTIYVYICPNIRYGGLVLRIEDVFSRRRAVLLTSPPIVNVENRWNEFVYARLNC